MDSQLPSRACTHDLEMLLSRALRARRVERAARSQPDPSSHHAPPPPRPTGRYSPFQIQPFSCQVVSAHPALLFPFFST